MTIRPVLVRREAPRIAPRQRTAGTVPVVETSYETNGITLRCLTAGEGPLALLLHGFPDSPMSWRRQIPTLAAAGYRVVAPWLRGYGRSSRPRGVDAYDIDQLTLDVAGLIAACGIDRRATVVAGHDWGGVIGWKLALETPDLFDQLVVLNAPHPATFARELRTPSQLLRSSYAGFFQLPVIPELLLRAGDWALLRRSMRRAVLRPGGWTAADWRSQRRALSTPHALTSALDYYRAAGRRVLRRGQRAPDDVARIRVRTLVLWGDRDPFLRTELLAGLEELVDDLTIRRFADAGHWVHWDRPHAVADALMAWLAPPAVPPRTASGA